MNALWHPMTGDGPRTKTVRQEIYAGRIKGDLARRILQQARYDDAREVSSLTTSCHSHVVHNGRNPQNANGGKP